MRRYVISDPHGNYKALKQVLKRGKFNYNKDLLIINGDVVDGYADSYLIIEELLKIENLIFIIGNHDIFFMNYTETGWAEDIWLLQGGKNTKKSYASHGYKYKAMPKTHIEFFNKGLYHYEIDEMLFVHGGFDYPNEMPETASIETLTWDRELLNRMRCGLKVKEWKKIFIGHTQVETTDFKPGIIDWHEGKFAKCIQLDCGAGWRGRLCLMDIDTEEYVLSDLALKLNPQGHDTKPIPHNPNHNQQVS